MVLVFNGVRDSDLGVSPIAFSFLVVDVSEYGLPSSLVSFRFIFKPTSLFVWLVLAHQYENINLGKGRMRTGKMFK